jgi:WD40 repeat protein
MSAFLDWLEKVLTWFFALAFGALLIYAGLRYKSHLDEESDPWLQAKKMNTANAYLAFLRQCHSCPQQADAYKALDELQRVDGLLSRLNTSHLPERASLAHPVFSPDGKLILATGGAAPDLWDAETGKRDSHGRKTCATCRGRRQIDALDFGPDGRRIGAGMPGREGGLMALWDMTSEVLIAEKEVEGADVKGVQFSPDGVWLGWHADGPVGLWNPVNGRFMRSVHPEVTSIAFVKDAKTGRPYFMSAAGKSIMVWEPTSMELIREAQLDSDRRLLGFSRDGKVLGYSDGRVLEIWDTDTFRPIASVRDLIGNITAFCRDTPSGRIVVGTQEGMIYLWDPLKSPIPRSQVAGHEGPIESLACGAEGYAVSISWDGGKVWKLDKLRSPGSAEELARRRKFSR